MNYETWYIKINENTYIECEGRCDRCIESDNCNPISKEEYKDMIRKEMK